MIGRDSRFVIAGPWVWSWYERACSDALTELGCAVTPFSWFDSFHRWVSGHSEPVPASAWSRIENRLSAGPLVWRLNRQLERVVVDSGGDVLWLYNARLVLPSTIRKLRKLLPRLKVVLYSNDNLFSSHPKPDIYRHILKSVPFASLNLAYRFQDVELLNRAGSSATKMLRSYFVPSADFPLAVSDIPAEFHADVVFAGHYEPDSRLEYLDRLAATNLGRFRLFGGGWSSALKRLPAESSIRQLLPTVPVVGINYQRAICGSKIALCFLSTNNRDTYTRRNFQIPAMGVFQLSQYSGDLATLFSEGRDIEFFRDVDELIDKVAFYLRNSEARERIARAGLETVWARRHDVQSRMSALLNDVRDMDVV